MKRKWIKRTAIIILAPILLFVVLMLSLYIPPVQNLLRKELTRYASQATGMQISMRRIDLRFPFNLQLSDVVASFFLSFSIQISCEFAFDNNIADAKTP